MQGSRMKKGEKGGRERERERERETHISSNLTKIKQIYMLYYTLNTFVHLHQKDKLKLELNFVILLQNMSQNTSITIKCCFPVTIISMTIQQRKCSRKKRRSNGRVVHNVHVCVNLYHSQVLRVRYQLSPSLDHSSVILLLDHCCPRGESCFAAL